jgi:replicative DNA helicase
MVVAAKRNSGKTTFVFFMAMKNAEMGHKVLFISLEMEPEDILDDFGRRYSGITVKEQWTQTVPDYKQDACEFKKDKIRNTPNLFLEGVRRGGGITWEMILEIIKKHPDVEMIFIDKTGNANDGFYHPKSNSYNSCASLPQEYGRKGFWNGRDERKREDRRWSGHCA